MSGTRCVQHTVSDPSSSGSQRVPHYSGADSTRPQPVGTRVEAHEHAPASRCERLCPDACRLQLKMAAVPASPTGTGGGSADRSSFVEQGYKQLIIQRGLNAHLCAGENTTTRQFGCGAFITSRLAICGVVMPSFPRHVILMPLPASSLR